ncbi:hypothetical protein KOJCDNHJ_03350 [Xanthomonas citri pv. punicae]|nr:hypothetical protein KOJCDNHJ_00636 [Xanthomonas citri pv. punicae]UIS27430.1 hypothetical protein KOJCDNHJ_00820 [Xanthomonas citri pv. punicae]UIS28226.1 hypothetical protein KOJCDNHJ_01621 [Xanthomonas citri pv. punicae]UIS28231.1 hypothetical protein KOJCDNHJ_01626 [Xanthomonas citri pv. punicae]UIS29929.1 hypothetical protein KOJCDNHJ_03350 [Xanthomonas citri pv. punicae]
MRIAPGLAAQRRTLPRIGLSQCDAVSLGQQHQLLAGHLQQPVVGGMGDRFFLHGGVHDHSRQLARIHCFDRMCGVDGVRQQLFHPGFAQALSPPCQGAGIARQAGLEHHLAGEKLPVRIFQPTFAHRFIGQVVGVLEVEQPSDQTHRQCGATACAGGDRQSWRQRLLQRTPRQPVAQLDQWMAQVDLVLQTRTKQLIGRQLLGGGTACTHGRKLP